MNFTKEELQFIKGLLLDKLDHHYLVDGENEMQDLLDAPFEEFRRTTMKELQKYKSMIRKIEGFMRW